MKRTLSGVAAGAIVGVAAGTAAGQAATLEFWPAVREIRADGLRDVAARLPSPVWPAASFPVAEDAVLTPGRYRIEVRYRVIDNIADARIPTGLSSTTLIVSASGPGVVGSRFERGRLTNHAVQDASVLQDDTTGFASGVTGLIGPFRGGLLDDADAGNGGASLGFPTFSVQPLALSSPGHQDPNLALCRLLPTRVGLARVRRGVFRRGADDDPGLDRDGPADGRAVSVFRACWRRCFADPGGVDVGA